MSYIQTIRKSLPPSLQSGSELFTFLALAGSISTVLVSIAASQILLAAAIIGSVWILRKNKGAVSPGMQILLPLIAFMIWTLLAIFLSPDVILGLRGTKKFFLYLIIPIAPILARGYGKVSWIYKSVFLFAAISSLKGLAQFIANPNRDLLHRITGFMSQWMTYSGLLMLVLVLLVAYAFRNGIRKHTWIIPLSLFVIVALALSLTRNSWMGAIAGIIVLVMIKRPRAIVYLGVLIALLYVLSPGVIKDRVKSIVDTSDPRSHVYLTGLHLIQKNPWFGVGPKNVNVEALKYRDEKNFPDWLKRSLELFSTQSKYAEQEKEFPGWLYQHMHNNFLQIAAETGIPGMLLWLWFMCRLAWDAWGCYRFARSDLFPGDNDLRNEAIMASTAALGAWTALMVAGIFEYNFGDSEVLTLFLFIMSAPYAFAVPDGEYEAVESPKDSSGILPG